MTREIIQSEIRRVSQLNQPGLCRVNIQFWSRLISIIWVASICVVTYASLVPRIEFPVDFWQADKFYHVIAYCWLSVLPIIGYSKRKLAITGSLSMIILGILLEIGQMYIPGRTFSMGDITANTLGVILGIFCGDYIRPQAEKLRNNFFKT
jgi:VanZ family protein